MLQPHKYPQMVGQSLVFEPEPFLQMADDDNPWVEGLFFITVIGFVVAVAQILGGWLLTAIMPAPQAVLEALVEMVKRAQPVGLPATDLLTVEATLRQWWPTVTGFYNYGNGWARLLLLIVTPLTLIGQWLAYGLLAHVTARALGGTGTVSQTLGVTALAVAPRVLQLVSIVPFASVGVLLFQVWGVLIAYRGLEVAHEFGVRKAATAALFPLLVMALLAFFVGAMVAISLNWLGGGL